MSTDRELLELAAKAANMDYLVWTPGAAPLIPAGYRVGDRGVWHPLTDDGDALRLAVALRLDIRFGATDGVYVAGNSGLSFDTLAPEVATRRAIVRAAAAIGGGK